MDSNKVMENRYVLERIYRGYGIEGVIIDEEQHVLASSVTLPERKKRFLLEINKIMCSIEVTFCKPFLYSVSENIYIWGIKTEDKEMCLFGPIGGRMLNDFQTRAFCFQYKLGVGQIEIPRLFLNQLLFFMCTSNYMLTGKRIKEEEVLIPKTEREILSDKDKVDYQIYQYEEEKGRTEYEMERQWLERIEHGKMNSKDLEKNLEQKTITMGTMAKDSDFKQYEYMAVSEITLATRAAIKGGVPPAICYENSDLLLQKTSKSKNINELLEIASQTPFIFSNLVTKYTAQQSGGLMIEQCKSYIAKHLYHPFTIQQMADDLSVDRSYLSKKFSKKTGQTIQNYIMDERLNAAANLLKYSDKTIGQIAEYMQFQNQGRFSQYFKKKYKFSPKVYREHYKSAEFIE